MAQVSDHCRGRCKTCFLHMKGRCGFRTGRLQPGHNTCENRLGTAGWKGGYMGLLEDMMSLMWCVCQEVVNRTANVIREVWP